jgi:Ti-type conjugative transfer relaxase TraA
MVALEKALVEQAVVRRQEGQHPVPTPLLQAVLESRTLSPEQTVAVQHLTQGAAGVACVVGMAGTGKSYALDAAREAWEHAGFRVTGAALAGKAAQGLQEAAQIPSTTLHALLSRLDSKQFHLNQQDILVIDEAGMVGSRQLKKLLDHAQQAGAKVALIGDYRQLQPIDAGGAFRLLKDRLGAPALTDIRRQHEAWARETVHQFAAGEAAQALAHYHERGLLTLAADRAAAIDRMARDWMTDRTRDPATSALLLTDTRQESRQLNDAVRDLLKAQGGLGTGVVVTTTHGVREFAAGDRILFTRNSTLWGVRNGTLGTVERIGLNGQGEPTLHVRLDDGRLTSIRSEYYNSFDHGYALTTHKAQGVTVDRAYVLTGGPLADRELTYVQMSRHRDSARIYVDRPTVDEWLRDAMPTDAMIRYAEDIATNRKIPLPAEYESNFVVCRDYLNAHSERVIASQEPDPTLQDLKMLARTLDRSHQKDTTQDYEHAQRLEPEPPRGLDRDRDIPLPEPRTRERERERDHDLGIDF